jgi:predicted MFS family arabinose efflux permease
MLSRILAKRWELAALLSMCGIYLISYFQRSAIPGTIFNRLQTELQLSASDVTGLSAMFMYIYAGMQLFVGIAADRLGGRRVLMWGGLLMLIGTTIFPLSHSLWALYLGRVLTSLGASCLFLSLLREVNILFSPASFAIILGFIGFSGSIGGILAMSPFNWASETFGWRETLLWVAGATSLFLIAGLIILRRLPVEDFSHLKPFSFKPVIDIVTRRSNMPLLVAGLINFSIMFMMQVTLGKKFLQDFANFTSSQASLCMLLMMVVCAVCNLGGGMIIRWMGNRRKPILIAVPLMLSIATLMLIIGVIIHVPTIYFFISFLILSTQTIGMPAINSTIKELNRPEHVAQSVAVINGLAYVGVAIITTIAGLILDNFSTAATVTPTGIIYPSQAYLTLFILLFILSITSLIISTRIPETRGIQAEFAPE